MNSTLKTLTTLAAGSVASIAFVGAASAVSLNANLGFTPIGTTSFTGATLGTATVIDFPSINIVNSIPLTYQPPAGVSGPNDFAAGGLAPVNLLSSVVLTQDPFTLSPGLPFVVNFTAGGNPATFTSSAFTRNSSGANALDLAFVGTITGTGFTPSLGSLTFAFTTTGGGIANYSATLASPPAITIQGVPEPGTVLALAALGGAGLVSRRRKS